MSKYKSKMINLRTDPEIIDQVERLAKDSDRTFHGYVLHILKAHLASVKVHQDTVYENKLDDQDLRVPG